MISFLDQDNERMFAIHGQVVMGGLDKDKILRMDKYKNVVLRLRFADKS